MKSPCLTPQEATYVYKNDLALEKKSSPESRQLTDERVQLLANTYKFMNKGRSELSHNWHSISSYISEYEQSVASPGTAPIKKGTICSPPTSNPASTVSKSALWALRGYARKLETLPAAEKKCIITAMGSELQITKKVSFINYLFLSAMRFIFNPNSLYNYTYKSLQDINDNQKDYILSILRLMHMIELLFSDHSKS